MKPSHLSLHQSIYYLLAKTSGKDCTAVGVSADCTHLKAKFLHAVIVAGQDMW